MSPEHDAEACDRFSDNITLYFVDSRIQILVGSA